VQVSHVRTALRVRLFTAVLCAKTKSFSRSENQWQPRLNALLAEDHGPGGA
jgi:hypothetical protein